MIKKYIIILLNLTILYSTELFLDFNKSDSYTIVENNSNNDSENLCLAISKKDLKYCSKIKNKDEKSSCFGILQKSSGYCTMITSENKKNACLSIALSNIDYCDKINDKNETTNCKLFYKKYELEKIQNECKEI